GVSELQAVQVLSFVTARCCALLNSDWLLQLQWQQEEEEPQTLSCCRVELADSVSCSAVHHCVSMETLFALSSTGLICILHGLTDELTSFPFSSSASFCLLQVSADLSTAVAVTQSHAAIAVDLNHYFRMFPDHLLCAAPRSRPPLQPQHPRDQDSLSSSSFSVSALGATFSTDRSWEARLNSMYSRAKQATAPSSSSCFSSSQPPRTSSWFSSLPYLDSHLAPSSSHSRVPPGGMTVTFAVPESSASSQLTVSEFSALLTFVRPGNQQTTVALWDMKYGNVRYHQAAGEAAPVQRCGERQHRLLLKKAGVFQVLFSVSQQDLLSRLMLFGSAATVDAVCHLNSWGRCSIPIHALQTGLKNRQLDTVDFYLKSKENVLNPPAAAFSSADQPAASTLRVQELCPALDLLCSAVRDSNSEAQSRQFSEQLLNITLSFVNTQIRSVLSNTHHEDSGVQSCMNVLDRYVAELRSYMKRFPWAAGPDVSATRAAAPAEEEAQRDEWEQLSAEEVVHQSILTNQIPRAQAVLRRQNRPECHLPALRREGLRQVSSCLRRRDLQTANTLLANMGFSVKQQLHLICLHTDDKELRELMVSVACFPLFYFEACSPFVSVNVYVRPRPTSKLFLLVAQVDETLRLDWVKNWDQSCRTAVLLSRLQHAVSVQSCDASVLWRYLTALHDQRRVVDWIQNTETSGTPRWPDLTPELVNDSTACSSYMRENILDLLARRGVFIPDELAHLEQLLWRLAQGGGVMSSSPPIPQYRSPLGLDLHGVFITFCLEHNLQYLLYTYLEHYRLTPRNCSLLSSQSLSERQPWFEMLVRIQEITRDLSDPGLVFQASLTSAQVLLPGSQASLSSLLLEGHSLLTLAAIMFAPGGIDQVNSRTVDPQLLKMALAPHPKLRAALFPAVPRGNGPPSDISVYHLLQSLHPLDPSRLFGWQAANTLNSTETSELPHFSSPHLVQRFALKENLDYLYFLHHGRPSFAYATFLVQHVMCPRLQEASRRASRSALQRFNAPSVASAAVCFCELLGVCSLKLRVDIRAMNAILQHWNQRNTHSSPTQLNGHFIHLKHRLRFLCVCVCVRSSYEAAQEWALAVQFCQLHNLQLSSVYPAHCAHDGQFIHFLLFVQLHNFPPQQVRSLAAQFGPTLQAHLSLAFQDLQVYCKRKSCDSDEQHSVLRTEEAVSGSPERPGEMFQVLLQSQEEPAPCRYLLQEALVQRCPTLAVLAACMQGAELLPCLCVWVLTSVDDVTAKEATSHLAQAPQHHEWTVHDLSIIWKTLLGRSLVRPLLRGFELFQKDCPLVLVLRMFELCCDYRNFAEAKSKLLDFQRTLIALRNGGPAPPGGLPLQWVESQASVLLLTMLQRCSSQYDIHRLLQLLADVDKLLKSNGPDFRKLNQLSQLLQGSEVSISPRLLQSSSPSVQQEEFQATVDALQARGCYSQARQVAQLAGLPVHRLLLSQLLQEVSSQRSKRQWGRFETRAGFWKKCHEQLEADATDPDPASQFFLSQAEAGAPGSLEAPEDLLDIQEHCLLLGLAAHWLSRITPAPVDKLESLEKEQWLSRIRRRILTVAMEKESVFNLPPPAVNPEMNTHKALMKEFSFSNITQLNTEGYLALEGLPGPSDEQEEPNAESALSPEERSVLAALIGQLLDDGSIHEASRVCRYFSLYHPDVWLVLRCRGLASGELSDEPPEDDSEAPARASITSSPSVSSLSSFVMLPLPEDEVAVQLQKLVDQCRHGNNYCKQVLSLYQLSKELQCSFSSICREEPCSVLEKLLLSEQPERFRKARAFVKAQGLSADAVAELISSAMVQALLASTQELQPGERHIFRPLEGRDALVQLIKLCDDPNLVGLKLLEHLNSVPLRDLNCIVELLIVAHDCFSLTCNMEGIVRVLQAARHLSHTYLAPGGHYSLLVRLLTGIGRYNEMTYVFDLLHQNHCFEMLLRKKSSSLKSALLDYIKRCLPADSEKYNMVALCFTMRREIGENHEIAARTQLKMIESQAWVITPELKSSLAKVLGLLKDAAESFSKDSCVRQATRCIRTAKLVALQLHFLNQGSDLRIINLRPAELLSAAMALPRCYQVFVVSEAYGYSPDWAEILYQKVVLNGDFGYLEELKRHRPLTSTLFEDIFKKLDGAPGSVTSNVKRLLTYCDDVYSRYRLAYQQNLHDITKMLLQDAKTSSYLSDRLGS
uniref:Spatacsin C-terminal domain-containing protein n=1 Tax=Astatotilapia calliptera TaxID=8154 RepID=A0A3P8R091_ASTCA